MILLTKRTFTRRRISMDAPLQASQEDCALSINCFRRWIFETMSPGEKGHSGHPRSWIISVCGIVASEPKICRNSLTHYFRQKTPCPAAAAFSHNENDLVGDFFLSETISIENWFFFHPTMNKRPGLRTASRQFVLHSFISIFTPALLLKIELGLVYASDNFMPFKERHFIARNKKTKKHSLLNAKKKANIKTFPECPHGFLKSPPQKNILGEFRYMFRGKQFCSHHQLYQNSAYCTYIETWWDHGHMLVFFKRA